MNKCLRHYATAHISLPLKNHRVLGALAPLDDSMCVRDDEFAMITRVREMLGWREQWMRHTGNRIIYEHTLSSASQVNSSVERVRRVEGVKILVRWCGLTLV